MGSFYECYIPRVRDPDIKDWLMQEHEHVNKLVEKKGAIGLADILYEYSEIIESNNYSYTVAFSKGGEFNVMWDALNKLTDFHLVFVSIHRRADPSKFFIVHGVTPDEFVNIMCNNEGALFPISMAPPWALEKPRIYADIVKRIHRCYGFYPVSPWARLTEYFSILSTYDWGTNLENWRKRAETIASMDPVSVDSLARKFVRKPGELLDIVSTKSLQLELFGYSKLLDLIYDVAKKIAERHAGKGGSGAFELLYTLVTIYHKYLLSGVLDYMGGIVVWASGTLNFEKLGLRPYLEKYPELIGPLAGSGRVLSKDRTNLVVNPAVSVKKIMPHILRFRDRFQDFHDYMARLNNLVKRDVNKFIEYSREYDEVLSNHVLEKAESIGRKFNMIKWVTSAGFALLSSVAGLAGIQSPDQIGIFLTTLTSLMLDIIAEKTYKNLERLVKNYILDRPLSTLHGHGIFWLIWSYST